MPQLELSDVSKERKLLDRIIADVRGGCVNKTQLAILIVWNCQWIGIPIKYVTHRLIKQIAESCGETNSIISKTYDTIVEKFQGDFVVS